MKKKPTHGGARKGAGRKPGKPTVTIAFRVEADKAASLKKKIKELIQDRDKGIIPV